MTARKDLTLSASQTRRDLNRVLVQPAFPRVAAIPTKLKVFPRPTEDADISGVMSAYIPPPEYDVRNEIREILNKITDSETLLFCLWIFKKTANNEQLPPPERTQSVTGRVRSDA